MIRRREVGSAWRRVPWARVFAGDVVADRLFLRSVLIRKDLLPTLDDVRAVIAGRLAPVHPDGRAYDDTKWWVLKPSDSSNAFGVRFFFEIDDTIDIPDEAAWILQPAISTRLLDGHRFHVRALVLLVGDLDAYVYDDARILVAPLATKHWDSDHARITNRSFNKAHSAYDDARHNISLSSLSETDKPTTMRAVRDVIALVARRLDDRVRSDRGRHREPTSRGTTTTTQSSKTPQPRSRAAAPPRVFFPLPNSYELLGVDFMVEQSEEGAGRLVLLEFNPEPSLEMWPFWDKDGPQGDALKRDVLLRGRCPVADGVPRTQHTTDNPAANEETLLGFTQVYSKRVQAALRAFRSSSESSSRSQLTTGT